MALSLVFETAISGEEGESYTKSMSLPSSGMRDGGGGESSSISKRSSSRYEYEYMLYVCVVRVTVLC